MIFPSLHSARPDLYIVETPFQLLCAYEAIVYFRRPFKLCLRYSGVGRNDLQLQRLADELDLRPDCSLLIRKHRWQDFLKSAPKYLLLAARSYENVFIGSYYSNVLQVLSRLFRKNQLVLLDDGVATFLVQDELQTKRRPTALYTIFDIPPFGGQNITKNKFSALRRRYSISKRDSIIFIGQELFSSESISQEAYIKFISELASSICSSLVYIAHRAEPLDVIERVEQIPNVTVVHPPMGIELFFLKEAWQPSTVISICSTAIFSLSALFPETRIQVLQPDEFDPTKFSHWPLIKRVNDLHDPSQKVAF